MSKIRLSFVSNSSSSSFVLIGHKIEFDKISVEELQDKKIFVNTSLYGNEGRVGCKLNKDIYNHLKMLDVGNDCEFIEYEYDIDSDYNTCQSIEIKEGKFDILSGEYDYYSANYILETESKEDFLRG